MGMNISQNYDEEIIPVWTLIVKILLSSLVAQTVKRLPTMRERLWCWEGLEAGGEGDDREWDGWLASLTQWTWVWVNSGSWWWTGRPGVLRFMGSQRVGHDWATELNWTEQCGRAWFDPWVGKILWRRKWQPTPVLLPGKSHRWRSMVGYSPWSRKESDTTKRLHLVLVLVLYWDHYHYYFHPHHHTIAIIIITIPVTINNMVSDHPIYGPSKCVRNRESARFNLYNLRQGIHCQMVTS